METLTLGGLIGPAVIAAIVSAVVTLVIAWRRDWLDERARRREMFAEAFSAYTAYKELPFVVRRRRPDRPEEERLRISKALREIQERLSFFTTWMQLEHPEVGQVFDRLVSELRRVAGGEIHRAWTLDPVQADAEMNIGDVDLSALTDVEQEYLKALSKYVRPWRVRLVAWFRSRKDARS